MSEREECQDCPDRGRCAAWFIMKRLPWVDSVKLSDGILTVTHSYPKGVNVSRHIRDMMKENDIAFTVELRVIRVETC